MKINALYIICGIAMLAARLYLNFSTEILLGVNGGYNLVQIRSILENGTLGFPDMPLYFYLNAFIVKISSWVIPIPLEDLILYVNKIIDSLSLALITIPLYLVRRDHFNRPLPFYFEIMVVAFATLSFAPLMLTSELQKNSAAIPLMVFFIYHLLKYFKNPTQKALLLSALFFVLTGLTHFGVFSIVLLILIVSLFVKYKRKAIAPTITFGILATVLVFIFDSSRAFRLLQSIVLIFDARTLAHFSPFSIFNLCFTLPISIFSLYQVYNSKIREYPFYKEAVSIFSITTIILAFPFIDQQFSMRFNLMLFVPISLLLMSIGSFLLSNFRKLINVFLSFFIIASLFISIASQKEPSITVDAYNSLDNFKKTVDYSDNTLFIAKHGVEWWLAWQLNAKVGQEKAITAETFTKYDRVISVYYSEGRYTSRRHQPFPNPYFPPFRETIYQSLYFKAVELTIDDLPAIEESVQKSQRPPRGYNRRLPIRNFGY